MVLQLRNYLRGAVQVELQGAAVERFFNLCAGGGIHFWEARALEPDRFTVWTSVRGYWDMRSFARKTGCRMRIRKKRGAPFSARRLTRRRVLWGGLLAAAALAAYLYGFIWTIQIEGCQELTQAEVLELLEQAGLKTGVRRTDCQPKELRNQVMLLTDKLSYLTVNFRGTQALVQIWERENSGKEIESEVPCDVVSDLAGVVLRLRVRTGKAAVRVGDTLLPGDTIAEGALINEQGEVTLLHAQAEADLRTWYTVKTLVPAELQVQIREGKAVENQYFQLGRRRFPLGRIEKNHYPWYDKQIERKDLQLHENFRWPICRTKETAYLCRVQPAEMDQAALADALKGRMIQRLLAQKPDAQLVQSSFSLEKTQKGAYLGVLRVELVETTGRQVPLE